MDHDVLAKCFKGAFRELSHQDANISCILPMDLELIGLSKFLHHPDKVISLFLGHPVCFLAAWEDAELNGLG